MLSPTLRTLEITLIGLALAGCGAANLDAPEVSGEEFGTTDYALALPQAEVDLILSLVNDPASTGPFLDVEVGLDARAAANIVSHRNGADGVYPSADDDLFDTVTELDLVAWVGEVALVTLRDYAVANAPAAAEHVEGVRFTSEQAEAVIWGVNRATVQELDATVGLDRRAAESLVAKRPFQTVSQMGAVSWVGASALTALRSHAPVWAAERAALEGAKQAGTYDGVTFDEATAQAALSVAQTATRDDLVAAGLPGTGAQAIVNGRPYVTLAQVAGAYGVGPVTMQALHDFAATLVAVPGPRGTATDGEECAATADCAEGLVCAGTTVYAGVGFCRPEWMAGTFAGQGDLAIPDNHAQGVVSRVTVSGLATVPEDVIVHLDIVHPDPSQLRVILTQPSSGEEILWEVGSAGAATVVAGWGIERDSAVNGEWTLTVIDTQGGGTGTLRGWSLELTSRLD